MPEFTHAVTLKIDFKFDQETGSLEILDMGPGLSADSSGFNPRMRLELIRYVHEFTGAAVVPLFNDILGDAVHPSATSAPTLRGSFERDMPVVSVARLIEQGHKRLLPISTLSHLETFVGALWQVQHPDAIIAPPLAFSTLTSHKLLWNCLVDESRGQPSRRIYWQNDQSPQIEEDALRSLEAKHGYFIKVVDNSLGTGSSVYYAANPREVRVITSMLNQGYTLVAHDEPQSTQDRLKQIFSIEPAFVTLMERNGQPYNATGRAFMTLGFNPQTGRSRMAIIESKWFLPEAPFIGSLTSYNMLANASRQSDIIPFTDAELDALTQKIASQYGKALLNCFIERDLFAAFASHSVVAPWIERLRQRPSPFYILAKLDNNAPRAKLAELIQLARDELVQQQTPEAHRDMQSCAMDPTQVDLIVEGYREKDVEEVFARLSQYHTLLGGYHEFRGNGHCHRLRLDLLKVYLEKMNPKYDRKDLSRALRQAALIADFSTLRVLIQIGLVNVNTLSPKNKQTALDIAMQSNKRDKQQCITLLLQAGAKSAEMLKVPGHTASGFFNSASGGGAAPVASSSSNVLSTLAPCQPSEGSIKGYPK